MFLAKHVLFGLATCLCISTLHADIIDTYKKASKLTRNEKAFDGAEGFGAYSLGGKGGTVIKVTTLEDNDKPGSLRWAVGQNYPRIIEFDVSGTLVLKSNLKIKRPFITIDGSTAPGKGVTLKDGCLSIEDTHDVILRYLKVRPGDEAILRKGVWKNSSRKQGSMDAINIEHSAFVIVDHCSTSWSSDEVLSTTSSRNVTVSNCIIAEPLASPDVHIEDGEKQSHPFGSLATGDSISYVKNLYAFLDMRAPQMGYESDDLLKDTLRKREVVNNLISGLSKSATRISVADPVTHIHVINNVYENYLSKKAVALYLRYSGDYKANSVKLPKLYISGNSGPDFTNGQWEGIDNDLSSKHTKNIQSESPLFNSDLTIWNTDKVKKKVLANAGAKLPVRDAIDKRVVKQVRAGTGNIIMSQDDVGGYKY
jgi:pectate lyase